MMKLRTDEDSQSLPNIRFQEVQDPPSSSSSSSFLLPSRRLTFAPSDSLIHQDVAQNGRDPPAANIRQWEEPVQSSSSHVLDLLVFSTSLGGVTEAEGGTT